MRALSFFPALFVFIVVSVDIISTDSFDTGTVMVATFAAVVTFLWLHLTAVRVVLLVMFVPAFYNWLSWNISDSTAAAIVTAILTFIFALTMLAQPNTNEDKTEPTGQAAATQE